MHLIPTNFWEWTSSFQPNDRLHLLLFGIFAAVVVIMILAGTVYKMHKNRLEDALKRDLLDRGMSADEIATVIRAKPGKSESQWRRRL